VLQVSVGWLVPLVQALWQAVPRQLPLGRLERPELRVECVEADEQWGFLGTKDCPVWLWLAVERRTGLVMGIHLGDRDEQGALGLWLSIPKQLRGRALVFTDGLAAYAAVFQPGQHQAEDKSRRRRSSGSTTPCASAAPGWCGRRSLSPNPGRTTSWPFVSS
jgi:IS1 family transposase